MNTPAAMQIVNPGMEDFHCHSSNFSDGMSTVEELVEFAGKIGLKTLAITDHSQASQNSYYNGRKTDRWLKRRWGNVHNDVKIIFGIEADLLNEKGEICDYIQDADGAKYPAEFLILSAHKKPYQDDPSTLTNGFINAIKLHGTKLQFLGHLCSKELAGLNVAAVVKAANEVVMPDGQKGLPVEFNCANFNYNKTDLEKLKILLKTAKRVYVNSDSHTLFELKTLRAKGFEFLRTEGYV